MELHPFSSSVPAGRLFVGSALKLAAGIQDNRTLARFKVHHAQQFVPLGIGLCSHDFRWVTVSRQPDVCVTVHH